MRDCDHFLSELDALGRSGAKISDTQLVSRLSSTFYRQVAPVVGVEAAEGLFGYWMDTYGVSNQPSFLTLGYLAAFLRREYDESTMPLDRKDFEELRDILNDAAADLDMDTLTDLMAELVSRGILK